MTGFQSRIAVTSAEFRRNRSDMLALVDKLAGLNQTAIDASEKRRDRFRERGQLTPRERIERLVDPGLPFLEIGNLAGYRAADPESGTSPCIPGGSLIAGIGFISGTRVMLVADDSGINAGAMTSAGALRMLRCQEITAAQKLPFIHLVESAGADLMNYRVEEFVAGGTLFYNLARLSAAGIPVITVLHGAATAGGAYMPGLSDYVVAVNGRARAFLAGPALLQAATGEIADEESLGGAEMHARVSGLAEYLAADDAAALSIARQIVRRLHWGRAAPVRTGGTPPRYDPDELAGVVPTDYRQSYDAREVVARLADNSEFMDFKRDYGPATVCLQSEVMGYPCAFIANNGPIDPDGATKATHFIQLCDQSAIPLVFLQNTTGFMVGTQSERAGMIKHGSKMIQAVSNARVPRFTLMIGASFGAGNYGMSGRGYRPDFLFAWPNAAIGVMGGEQAAKTMQIVAEAGAARRGTPVDTDAINRQSQQLRRHFDIQSDAFHASGRGIDDGVIDPRDSRRLLGFLLETVFDAAARQLHPNSFGVARP